MNRLYTFFKILLPGILFFQPAISCTGKEHPEGNMFLQECDKEESAEEWNGEWISLYSYDSSSLFLRRDFYVLPEVKKATLYIKSSGNYIVYLNGKEIIQVDSLCCSDKVYYKKYDIANYIQEKENGVGVYLQQDNEENSPVISARIKLEYTNRNFQHIRTDYRWLTVALPATICVEEFSVWSCPGYKAKDWLEAREILFYPEN